jgi:hypothetical protein
MHDMARMMARPFPLARNSVRPNKKNPCAIIIFNNFYFQIGVEGGVEEEEEEEEEEGLYLRIETRKRVQTNEAKSKRRRASPT